MPATVVDVILTPNELKDILANAEHRNEVKEAKKVRTHKISENHSDLELHQLEVAGQYAVAKYLDEPMDWSVSIGGNKTRTHFYVDGYSMRVQTPTHHPPILKFNRAEDFNTDLAVVCMVREPLVVAIYGCVSRERFLREHLIRSFGFGRRLTMVSQYLTPIGHFRAEAESGLRKEAARATAAPSHGKARTA